MTIKPTDLSNCELVYEQAYSFCIEHTPDEAFAWGVAHEAGSPVR